MAIDLVKERSGARRRCGPVPAKARCCPKPIFSCAGRRAARSSPRCKGATGAARRIVARARAGPAGEDQGGGGDPGFHRGEGNRSSRRTPAHRLGVRHRLRLGMRLQSDPTIIYGITKGYPLGRRIRQSEIDRATPYNTYAIAVLRSSRSAIPARIRLRPFSTRRTRRTCSSSPTHGRTRLYTPAARAGQERRNWRRSRRNRRSQTAPR